MDGWKAGQPEESKQTQGQPLRFASPHDTGSKGTTTCHFSHRWTQYPFNLLSI